MFTDGFISSLADGWNVGILIFLVVLGIIMPDEQGRRISCLRKWASENYVPEGILATFGLESDFVDDYFNCLTVGNVMGPSPTRRLTCQIGLSG